ncbi:uncharacterized protein LOC133203822 [Saccostrea echinata]|uniref:uncharacterized protein LOC133203822 n=1 Tax=Saccostrea echinata TaxID=191078 RepID=UPI002A7EAA7D|nr:uncharacterized protein LOC133203822 [Saccostrea echinata]
MVSFRLFTAVLTLTFYFDFIEATHNKCATEVCMDSKIDINKELRERINFTSGPEGFRVRFKPGLFSFGCSYFYMYKACVPTGLDPCIPIEYRNRVKEFFEAYENIACTKADRLDKLIDCMNNEKVQKMFFEDLVFEGFSLLTKMKTNDSDVCSEMKSGISATVTKLSAYCDHDGLRALLQYMNELAEELQDVFQMVESRSEYKEICYDEFMEVTSTAQSPLTRRASVVETSRILRSLIGL